MVGEGRALASTVQSLCSWSLPCDGHVGRHVRHVVGIAVTWLALRCCVRSVALQVALRSVCFRCPLIHHYAAFMGCILQHCTQLVALLPPASCAAMTASVALSRPACLGFCRQFRRRQVALQFVMQYGLPASAVHSGGALLLPVSYAAVRDMVCLC